MQGITANVKKTQHTLIEQDMLDSSLQILHVPAHSCVCEGGGWLVFYQWRNKTGKSHKSGISNSEVDSQTTEITWLHENPAVLTLIK